MQNWTGPCESYPVVKIPDNKYTYAYKRSQLDPMSDKLVCRDEKFQQHFPSSAVSRREGLLLAKDWALRLSFILKTFLDVNCQDSLPRERMVRQMMVALLCQATIKPKS